MRHHGHMNHDRRGCGGFTLIEILLVIIVLGILAAVAVPKLMSATDDARMRGRDRSLAILRSASETYYHEHNGVYPGTLSPTTGAPILVPGASAQAFIDQLTLPTNLTGLTSPTWDNTHRFGPYLRRGIPPNPYNGLTTIVCDLTVTDVTVNATDGTSGWKFYVRTGVIIPNDGARKWRGDREDVEQQAIPIG